MLVACLVQTGSENDHLRRRKRKVIICSFSPGKFNNYLIAGNVCNAFALGEIGSETDFFLVGSEPDDESPYPLLTGSILDSEGNVLFRLVRNMLVLNPGHCSKIRADLTSYEIHDSAGKPILSIRTMFEPLPNNDESMYVTTIRAKFYNRSGELVFSANSGDETERIEASCKAAFGSGGLAVGYTEDELQLVNFVMATRGRVNRLVTGLIEKQDVVLDGALVRDATLRNCVLHVKSGNFILIGQNKFDSSEFRFEEEAGNVFQLASILHQPKDENPH